LPGAALDLSKMRLVIEEAIRKNIKKAALLSLALPAAYIADVWILGSASAVLYDQAENLKNIFAKGSLGNISTAPWYFQHPFEASWAWLTRPSKELTVPAVREIWLVINGLLIGAGMALHIKNKLLQLKNQKNDATHVHGLEVVNNSAFGATRWAGMSDISHYCQFGPPQKGSGGVVLGKLEKQIVRVIPGKNTRKEEIGLTGHVVAYGVTGSGKSFTFVRNNIIAAVEEGQSMVIMDPKGELLETNAAWLEENGYYVPVFNLVNPACSNRWNPIMECRSDEEIAEMASCMIENSAKDSHGYFVNKEIQLLEALSGLLNNFPPEHAHLRSALSLSSWSKEKLEQVFAKAYREKRISNTIYERWRGAAKANFEEAASGLTAKLKIITTQSLAALMSGHEIDLESVGRKKTALFCILPVKGSNVFKPILSVFYMFLFNRLYDLAFKNGGKLPVEVRVIADEFANIGRIPGFSEKISTARSLGILLQYILQGRSQLDDIYGKDEANNILASTPISLLLGVAPNDAVTTEMFSKNLGEAAVFIKQVNYRKNILFPIKNLEHAKETTVIGRRKLMEPYEIKEMPTKYCIADIQASKPMFLKKLPWVDLPQAKEIKRCGIIPVSEFIPPRELTVKELTTFEMFDKTGDEGETQTSSMLWGIRKEAAKQGFANGTDAEYAASGQGYYDQAKANEDKVDKKPTDESSRMPQVDDVEFQGFNASKPIF